MLWTAIHRHLLNCKENSLSSEDGNRLLSTEDSNTLISAENRNTLLFPDESKKLLSSKGINNLNLNYACVYVIVG